MLEEKKRNFGLDLLRAISIWLVLFQHLGIKVPGLDPLQIGGLGVEVFFVLSGFLIGGILFREIENENSFSTLKKFWMRRWLRILPLYYLVLLFKFVVIDSSIGWNILYYVFFLQNNFYGIHYLGVSWSLVIEEWFYLFVPLFLMALYKYLRQNKYRVLFLLLFLIGVNVLRFIYVYFTNAPYQGVNGNFPFRFDSLFNGVLLAYLSHKGYSLFKSMQNRWWFLCSFLMLLGYLYLFAIYSKVVDDILFFRTIGFYLLSFMITLIVPFFYSINLAEGRSTIGRAFNGFVTKTSIYTYSLYLTHTIVFGYIHSCALSNKTISTILCICMSYAISYFLYNYFEKPILRLRDKLTV